MILEPQSLHQSFQHTAARRRLAGVSSIASPASTRFNTQPPEGGWLFFSPLDAAFNKVSTHSRPKAAGGNQIRLGVARNVSTHSRPKAAGKTCIAKRIGIDVSTHSRPKAAGSVSRIFKRKETFQHTAARRRLVLCVFYLLHTGHVSTHSRPKAAGSCV